VITNVASAKHAVRIVESAEAAGFERIGIGDTGPKLYQAVYPTVAAALLSTDHIQVGPAVTNFVSQHWSVHATTARTMHEFAPGRFFLAAATGDGALHSVGLEPARWSSVVEAITDMRRYAPDGLEIHVAVSGPKGAEAAAPVATDLLLGIGLDDEATQRMAGRARRSREAAGLDAPLRIWAHTLAFAVKDEDEVQEVRANVRGLANGYARMSFDATFQDKGIPEEWQPVVRERLRRYDFDFHAKGGGAGNPNVTLFEDRPDIQGYLIDRMLLVGTYEQCAARIRDYGARNAIDGLWFAMLPFAGYEDPADGLAPFASALRDAGVL
jgi:alkanesulfonate monooxygenase SsuD/methylene tetrahydromethanopterin reductase-like flavin-dependent oxidoreductase (luciferase family)